MAHELISVAKERDLLERALNESREVKDPFSAVQFVPNQVHSQIRAHIVKKWAMATAADIKLK
jgi:hypothetical protein